MMITIQAYLKLSTCTRFWKNVFTFFTFHVVKLLPLLLKNIKLTLAYCWPCGIVSDPIVLGNLSCTFEAGFCLWRNELKDDNFNWLLTAGTTPSRYTGPQNDHTFGTNKGSWKQLPIDSDRSCSKIKVSLCFILL